jgi:hypothetical protein
VREEAVVAEAQRYRIGRRAKHRVRAELVPRRHDGERRRMAVYGNELPDVVGFDQRNVAGQLQQVAASAASSRAPAATAPVWPSRAPSFEMRAP